MLSVDQFEQIRRMHFEQGMSQREIAKELVEHTALLACAIYVVLEPDSGCGRRDTGDVRAHVGKDVDRCSTGASTLQRPVE